MDENNKNKLDKIQIYRSNYYHAICEIVNQLKKNLEDPETERDMEEIGFLIKILKKNIAFYNKLSTEKNQITVFDVMPDDLLDKLFKLPIPT